MIGKPGMLQSMRSQRIRHDLVTEQLPKLQKIKGIMMENHEQLYTNK